MPRSTTGALDDPNVAEEREHISSPIELPGVFRERQRALKWRHIAF
jgi:hypothetical protein